MRLESLESRFHNQMLINELDERERIPLGDRSALPIGIEQMSAKDSVLWHLATLAQDNPVYFLIGSAAALTGIPYMVTNAIIHLIRWMIA